MNVEKNKLKTHEKNDQTVRKVVNAIGCEKACKTLISHNLLTVCQENYERSFGKQIPQEFKIGNTTLFKIVVVCNFICLIRF